MVSTKPDRWPLRPKSSHHVRCQCCCMPDLERLSVDVRWRPLLAVAIVTHVVTQSLASMCHVCLLGACPSLTTPIGYATGTSANGSPPELHAPV